MKKVSILMLATLLSYGAFSQFQIGASGSYLKGTGDNNRSLWGGGLTGKFFLGNNIALGAGFRVLPKIEKSSTGAVGGSTVTTSDNLSQVFGSLDIFLNSKKKAVQPYFGVDAGISNSNRTILVSGTGSGLGSFENNETFFYLAPKLGVNIGLSPAVGIFGQASYGLTFGNGEDLNNLPQYDSKPVDKFFVFDAGLYVRLSGTKK